MQNNKVLSLVVGLFVVLGIAGLFFLGFKASSLGGFKAGETYQIKASFGDVSGLGKDAKVTLAGVQIGRVSGITIGPKPNEATVILDISQSQQLPVDSSAQILTSGLLGARYIGINLGLEKTMLKSGDTLAHTGGSLVLEKVLQRFAGGGGNFYSDQFYTVTGLFSDVTGLSVGASVTQSGVQIGEVTAITLDQKSFQAVVTMKIDAQYNQIPLDSTAEVLSSSLIGGKFIGITPGGDTQMLADNGQFQYTTSSVVLEKVIQQFITNMSMKN